MVSAESQAAMDAAKKAVMEFMSKNGRNDTTVHEKVAPAVYHESISRVEKEELVTLVDREITQDHYHTSVQPITDSETLEEQHHHNLLPVENRVFDHDDESDRDLRLAAEMAKFKNEVQHTEGEHTQTVVPMVAAEHIHHHVHEIIQPVVQKHTIEPHVIHTTVQIHELVHNASKHHTMSALPLVTMAEFKKQGGILIGREERWDSFEGEPRSVGGNLGTSNSAAAAGNHAAPTAPERRSSMAPQRRASNPALEKTSAAPNDKPIAANSSSGMPEASKAGENPAQNQSASRPTQSSQSQPGQPQSGLSQPPQSQSQPQSGLSQPPQPQSSQGQQAPGRFNFLPMNLSRGMGDAQMGHPPIRAPLRISPGPADSRQASVAKPGEQKPSGQDQSQSQPRRAS